MKEIAIHNSLIIICVDTIKWENNTTRLKNASDVAATKKTAAKKAATKKTAAKKTAAKKSSEENS